MSIFDPRSTANKLAIRQGLVEKVLTDATAETYGATVMRLWALMDVQLDKINPRSEPVVVTLKSQYGETREVQARYGRGLRRRAEQSDAHDSVWSAMDVGFKTGFPHIKEDESWASSQQQQGPS
ncbi:hypothetical protein B0H16DRAFT_1736046 [Mycena metata]|uniref:Uncharacterized protein n=1 Tax=Mycena metata TaxID=1033252 RepID=A0AAD7HQ97_9AGAR|nr:hypothetical protein B0H16DRAFT_1736046 [Mycena metata]